MPGAAGMLTAMRTSRKGLAGALFLSLPVVLLAGCQVASVRDNGPVRTETRDVSGFSQIEVGGGADVTITIADAYKVTLTAEDHVLKVLDSRIDGDRLVIDSREGYTTSVAVQVDIHLPRLTGLTLSGGTHGTVRSVAGETLALDLSGGSEATISGQASSATVEASGGSQAHLRDLPLERATVHASGGSQVELSSSDRVEGSASGGSQVNVWGGATLAVETSGGSGAQSH